MNMLRIFRRSDSMRHRKGAAPGGPCSGMLIGYAVFAHFAEKRDPGDAERVDWSGNVVWEFNKAEFIEDPGQKPQWMARQHHDFQREGSTTGYYAPGMEPRIDSGNTLILCHRDAHVPYISDKPLVDDVIYEVNWEGEIIWEWQCSDHVEEMGFSEEARNAMCRDPNFRGGSLIEEAPGLGDWMHVNSMSRTSGTTRATSASIPTTSSLTGAKPTSS